MAEPVGPVNLALPVIEGDPEVGGELTSTGGEWTDANWLTYTWSVDGELSISGTAPVGDTLTFPLHGDLAGKSIGLSVVASSDFNGYDGVELAAVPVTVRAGTFRNVSWNGIVTGRPAVGQALTVAAPSWETTTGGDPTLTYQWFRNSSPLMGATGPRYVLTATDLGQAVRASVRLSMPSFTDLTLTSQQVRVAVSSFTSAPTPTVTGTARVYQVQTANPGNWLPVGAILSYQWYRGAVPIARAVSRTYTAAPTDSGKAIKVRVRASKIGYATVDRYSALRSISPAMLVATKSPVVVGTHRYGQWLSVSQAWSPTPTSVRYQWLRNGVAVPGATLSRQFLNPAYVGARVSLRITVAKAGYPTRVVTTPQILVGRAVMMTTASPTISGTSSAGSILTAGNGTYSPAATSFSYQWYRSGAPIAGARGRTYRVATADNGRAIQVRVTASRAFYESRNVGSALRTIPVPPRTVLRGDGVYRVGAALPPGLYHATGTGSGCYWERLSNFSGSFSAVKSNYFGTARTYVQILAGDVGFSTEGCGAWTTAPSSGAHSNRISVDGTYRVGIDILPGRYYGYGAGKSCYWETTSGFSGSFAQVIDNYFGSARTIVDIPASAKGFAVNGCGTLSR